MSETRKISLGAMLVGMVGALMLLDRYLLGSFLDVLNIIILAIALIIYMCIFDLKSGVMVSFALAFVVFFFGSLLSIFYFPLGILFAYVYTYGLKMNWQRKKTLRLMYLIACLAEIIIYVLMAYFFNPNELGETFKLFEEYLSQTNYLSVNAGMIAIYTYLSVGLMFIITGITEVHLIDILFNMINRRFNFVIVNNQKYSSLQLPSWCFYLALALTSLVFFCDYVESQYLTLIISSIALLAACFLVAVGFKWLLRYLIRFGLLACLALIIITFFMPVLIYLYLVLGFLVGTTRLKYAFRVHGEKR